VWSKPDNVLQAFASGWSGGQNATKLQKTINMHKVKAETAFSADDYFSMVFEKITGSADVNMGDLTGTELEKAETELFRQAIAEGVRATMWLGDTDGEISSFTTFNGFLKSIREAIDVEPDIIANIIDNTHEAVASMQLAWNNATAELKALRSEGNLVYLVSSDILNKYMEELDAKGTDSAYRESIDGRPALFYHGIPVIEVPLGKYSHNFGTHFCILTDRRNFVLALNTADMPENEVRMWYNPDEMENRQRAVFLAGTEILDLKLVSACISEN
jgi:hypothetical protein